MARLTFDEFKDVSITLAGLVGLQLPCLISRASPKSSVAQLQYLGFPFNMSSVTLNKHFSFSPENLNQGRYHTLVTNLFNHVDEQHLMNNLSVLIPDGYRIHRRFGRKHLLAVFLGGGVAGNLSQLCFYIYHQTKWNGIFSSPTSWGIVGDYLAGKVEKVYTSVYGNAPCIGASAAVCSIIAVETCANVVSLYDKYMELRRRRRMGTADREWDNRVMQQVVYEVCHLGLVIGIVVNDLLPLIASAESGKGIIETFTAGQTNGIGHAAHIGGFLFGVAYYIIMLTGYRRRIRFLIEELGAYPFYVELQH